MNEDKTAETLHLPSFEERVLAKLDEVSLRLAVLEKRSAERDAETKPNWDRLLKEFQDMNTSFSKYFKNFDRKLDVMNSEMLQMKADQKGAETRLDKIEAEGRPQIIVQDRHF
ncbi:MAG TPA: hypothetical protein VNO50_20560 [Pyrinomonadaceae bacterium]|nr:hypothetical protein [Pyrinomonadaceae bacterium]